MKNIYPTLLSRQKNKYIFAFCMFLFVVINSYSQATHTYSSNGVWTCPAGVTNATVECWGGGGGGGGVSAGVLSTTSGGGGGGGSYASSIVTVTPGTTYSVNVGSGGTAGPASNAVAGNGGDSWFNTVGTVFAEGGKGGTGSSTNGSGGALGSGGGAASIGTIKFSGGSGARVAAGSSGGGGGGGAGSSAIGIAAIGSAAGTGGGINGGNGAAGATTINTNGNPGNVYGGGGSGGYAGGILGASATGGAGSGGYIAVSYVCSTPPLSGVYTVGGAGSPNFVTLTQAFTTMDCAGLAGNVSLVLQSGYTSAGETFPLTPSTNTGIYTVTIYPGVTGLSITSANATGTFNFDYADNYVIDGRVNKAGAADLIVANTSTTGYAMQFIDDATYNTVKYCSIRSVNTSTTQGTVLFSTASSTGNDYNIIDYCDIRDGATTPYNGIFSLGTVGSENDNNIVSNCNVYNFYHPSGNGAHGIYLSTGNSDWSITGNSFYETAARVPTAAAAWRGIEIINTGNNFTVSNNYIGGSAANCGGGALSFDAGATRDNTFYGIYVSAGTLHTCKVQNNTISNITYGVKSATAASYSFLGIAITGGYVVVSNNTIGGATGTGSINLVYSTTSTQGFIAGGILSDATQGSVINNNIGSITISGGKTTLSGGFRGMECDGALTAGFTISNNIVGSTTTANSIQYSGGTTNPVTILGLFTQITNAFDLVISGNTFQNITNTGTGATGTLGAISGIYNVSTSLVSITSNTVANLSTAAVATGAMIGIYGGNTTAGQTISGNIIHDLSNTYNGATAVDIHGIYYAGPTTGANSISANAIYNLTLASTNVASTIYGLYISSGIATASNNMITLGNGVTTGYVINGIHNTTNTNANNYFYYNSIYIGGVAASGASNTNGFFTDETNPQTLKNNIFYNARAGGTGKHFAINISSTTGFTSDYNDLFTSTGGANCGSYNGGTTARTFAVWQTGTGKDGNSVNVDPVYVSPTTATPDIHITAGSGVVNKAITGTGITNDFDNSIRSSTTPDCGAHEYHVTYYSKSTGNLDLVATWGLNTDGSGANPPNFTTSDCNFNIRNNATPTLGAAWAVTGDADLIVLGDGTSACNFTIPGAYSCSGIINISNNGTLTNQNASNPTFNNINSNSTVNYNSASGVAQAPSSSATYGNLILSNSSGAGSSIKTLAANINIVGDLSINGYTTFDMVTFNANRTGGGGTFTMAANSVLKLSGTTGGASTSNNFPTNFGTMTLSSSSTQEYYGATQTIYDAPTYGNLTLSTAGTKTAGGALTIAGVFTISSPATFAASTYIHNIDGNFVNNGTFTANTSTANFNGVSAQIISGSTTTTFNNLTLNNSTGLSLSTAANVSGALTLTSGLLATTSANILTMTSTSTATVGTSGSTSYINGPMMYQKSTAATATLNFPIGKGTECRPFALTLTHTSTTLYNYQAEVFNTSATGLGYTLAGTTTKVSDDRYWTITRTDGGGASQPTAGLSGNQQIQLFFAADDYVTDGTSLCIAKNTAAAPTQWIDIGGSGGPAYAGGAFLAGSITSTSAPSTFTSFSTFTLANKSGGAHANPLPVSLTSFTAKPNTNSIDLLWTTATEINNDFFTIERSSDGFNFSQMATVKSRALNGNSNETINYILPDNSPLDGVSYYRLKQTDYNGEFKYFQVVSVEFKKNSTIKFIIYPNPNSGEFNVDFSGIENNHEIDITMYNQQGKIIYSNKVYTESITNGTFKINANPTITPGAYIVNFTIEGVKYPVRVIVN